jgi:hypothetical protein
MAQSALIQDFFIPVSDDALSGMSFFTILLKGYEEGITAVVLRENNVLNFGNWSFEDASTFAQKEIELKRLYPKLFAKAESITRLWAGRRYTLVDADYVPQDPKVVLKTVTGGEGVESAVVSTPLFDPYHALVNMPVDHPWIWNETIFSRLKKNCSNQPTVFFFSDGPFATVHIFDGRKWVLSVPYTAQQIEDACYFVLYALDELHIEAGKTNVYFAGIGFDANGISEVLERFVLEVKPFALDHWTVNHELAQHAVALESYIYHAHH